MEYEEKLAALSQEGLVVLAQLAHTEDMAGLLEVEMQDFRARVRSVAARCACRDITLECGE